MYKSILSKELEPNVLIISELQQLRASIEQRIRSLMLTRLSCCGRRCGRFFCRRIEGVQSLLQSGRHRCENERLIVGMRGMVKVLHDRHHLPQLGVCGILQRRVMQLPGHTKEIDDAAPADAQVESDPPGVDTRRPLRVSPKERVLNRGLEAQWGVFSVPVTNLVRLSTTWLL